MATALENQAIAYNQACARLAELDAETIVDRIRATYTVGQRTYGWNEYRAALLAQIKAYEDGAEARAIAAQIAAGPFTIIGSSSGI